MPSSQKLCKRKVRSQKNRHNFFSLAATNEKLLSSGNCQNRDIGDESRWWTQIELHKKKNYRRPTYVSPPPPKKRPSDPNWRTFFVFFYSVTQLLETFFGYSWIFWKRSTKFNDGGRAIILFKKSWESANIKRGNNGARRNRERHRVAADTRCSRKILKKSAPPPPPLPLFPSHSFFTQKKKVQNANVYNNLRLDLFIRREFGTFSQLHFSRNT